MGGAQVYAATLPLADRCVVTEIDLEVDGDAFAPGLTTGPQGTGRSPAPMPRALPAHRTTAGRPPLRVSGSGCSGTSGADSRERPGGRGPSFRGGPPGVCRTSTVSCAVGSGRLQVRSRAHGMILVVHRDRTTTGRSPHDAPGGFA
ncbi:dihydrofolate reductase [Oerskovia sp. M15]